MKKQSAHWKATQKHAKGTVRRKALGMALCAVLTASAVLSGFGGALTGGAAGLGKTAVYAKDIGKKNLQACEHCEMVDGGEAPSMADYSSYVAEKNPEPERAILNDQKTVLTYGSDGYSTTEVQYERLLDGAVYRGGNAKSGKQKTTDSDPDIYFDEDPNDFASVLPYGNTYIDTSKLNWNENNDFTIEIAQGAPFKWIAGENYSGQTDSTKEFAVVTDPLGDGSGLAADVAPIIAYVGPIKGYLGDRPEDWRGDSQSAPADGQENIIDASSLGLEYLYRITYRDAATLKDGTKGNLVITATRVEIETTATQDNAVITLQLANSLNLGAHLKKKNGDYINTQEFVAKTAAEMKEYLAGTPLSGNAAWEVDKHTLAATGVIIDLDIKVTDTENNPVKGSISYAARDMDIENFQSQWGRSIAGEDRYMFNEALTIVEGSLSYAVTPYYDHAHETTRATGWIPVRPGSNEVRNSPLHITKTGSKPHADGVRFSGVGNVMMRDKNESYKNALANSSGPTVDIVSEIRTALDKHSRNADTMEKLDVESYTIPNKFKQQLYGKIKDGDTVVPVNQMTNQQIFDYLGDGSFGDRRGDLGTFDTGFAVLMDASGFKLQWSGSMHNAGNIGTNLFDNSIYTLVEQSHGTGGGTYLETYDIANNCAVTRAEGTVTMGKGTDATVTVVPEDNYRVRTIRVGGTGLSDATTYDVQTLTFTDGMYVDTDKGVTIEKNADGTYDVTLANMQNPRHVHADFAADYYFYKVWKDADKVAPVDLTLTAKKYAYVFKDVEIDGTTYTFDKTTNTFTGADVLRYEADALITGSDWTDARKFELEGNSFVEYGAEDPSTGVRPVLNTYPINVVYEEQGESKIFTVTKADADNPEETHVEKSKDGSDEIWKISYPAESYTTKSGVTWPVLEIEPEPSAHNVNHDKIRYYWFVTETVNGWKLVEYDNSSAWAPGVVDAAEGRGETVVGASGSEKLTWATTAVKDHDAAAEMIAAEKNAAYLSASADGGKIVNEITPPVGKSKETWGAKNTPQTADGKSMFTVTTDKTTTGENNSIVKVELLNDEGSPAEEVVVKGGKYTIDEDGTITFTPDEDFVGDPPAVNVRGTDGNGLTAETTYTPHIVDNEKTVTRTITYEYFNGMPVLDEEGNPKKVVHTTTFVASVDPNTGALNWNSVKDPETGEVTPMENPSSEFPQVDSDPIEGYTPDKDSVSQKTVTPADSDWAEKVIYSPLGVTAKPDETYGLPGEPQTGTPAFEMETPTMPDGTPNEVTPKLVDPETGEETDTVTIPGQGTYVLNEDGTITFTPEDGFTENPDPVEVMGTDRNGKTAKTTYTPHIVDPTDTGTASRTVHFTYLTEDGEMVTEDVVQELTLTRHAAKVDPATGEVLEWGPWEKKSFPAVTNPDDKVDGRIWTTDDAANEIEVTEPGDQGIEYIVYEKVPYTVVYHNGDHGASDGKGDQPSEDYDSDVTGGNTVTPDSGWKFTGKYTYVITDRDGNVIGSGETDDPTSLKVIGNIEFTPVYEKLPHATYIDPATGRTIQVTTNFLDENTEPPAPADPTRDGYTFDGWDREVDDEGNVVYKARWVPWKYTIKYDANGGKGTMNDQIFTSQDSTAESKTNEFTRDGYKFTGFKARAADGSYLKDANGKDLLFTDTNDFMNYLASQGPNSEVTLVAQWEKLPPASTPTKKAVPAAAEKAVSSARTGDEFNPVIWITLLAAGVALLLIILAVVRRRRK